MLSGSLLAGELLDVGLGTVREKMVSHVWGCMRRGWGFSHVTKGNHADRLPDGKTDAGSDTTVEASKTVRVVNVAERVADRHLLGAVGVVRLGLHLDADDLDGLVPGGETTTDGGGDNLLAGAELVLLALAGDVADTALGEAAETEAGAPVGHLADGDGVDALVDAADAVLAVNVHKGGKGGLGLDAGRGLLVLGDFDRLHAGAEAHGGVGLGDTTRHAADDAATKLGGAKGAGVVLGLGCDKEEDSALGGGFDPGPGDEALVDCEGGMVSYRVCDRKGLRDKGKKKKTYSREHHLETRCVPRPQQSRRHGWRPWWSW